MKPLLFYSITILFAIIGLSPSLHAQPCYDIMPEPYVAIGNRANLTFKNQSDYHMTLRIVYSYGGLYTTVLLPPHENRIVSFGRSGTFKLKIKATSYGSTSYHDGGTFSVTCNQYEWTEGEIVFSMSTYGSGLGPSISSREFESDY